ncbi:MULTISPECIES: response regulator transcription factor [Leptolyngbya]|jgi:DNA-binding response OmpR family regulator|uniref:Two-component response regulator n=2 Tax=Leptolyngbya boryana TaxID=1184 RepID=A0A1Z4JJP4_LEPBY|nr:MULTISPECIES: response regulator transcription factor [Leptolyngbya]BAY56955.1 two-component response regulator [Leptolyngbya boryana NIES-2135]MBD1854862.1 response regulator transcription factor [Leptolyngbya sp. FACHB-1624]MBD2369032.1 response regulator transcription factor [Leptolyngbya sp. FACHB-161]MBD2377710.1 response regulator transcription factor [Leptolyngbya sp. FACHB-238]MBD2399874.1 response regulator transcription factor [Leptolyngbya sp. FACHB-239]
MNRILIAEDESRIAAFLEKGFRANGFTCTIATNGHEAIGMAHSHDFDLLILDLGLPGKNGWQVLEEVRGRGERLRIIVLTAQDEVEDTVAALEGGANDYVTKPFEFTELLARVKVQLRDSVILKSKAGKETTFQAGEIVLDLLTRQVWRGSTLIEMSSKEFALAEVFLRHPMQVMSREQLLDRVWGYTYDPGSNIIDAYIKQLRKKLGSETIETVRGVGYRLRV